MLIRILSADIIQAVKLNIYGKKHNYNISEQVTTQSVKRSLYELYNITPEYFTCYAEVNNSMAQLTDNYIIDESIEDI